MLLTVKETAKLLRKADGSIYDDFAKGVFPPGVVVKVGGRLLFYAKGLEEWIARGGTLAQKTEKKEAQEQATTMTNAA